MKRVIASVVVLVTAVGVVGCKNKHKDADMSHAAVMEPAPQQPVPYTPQVSTPPDPLLSEPMTPPAVTATPAPRSSAVSSGTGARSSAAPAPSKAAPASRKYKVREGDTLTKIAKQRGTTISRIVRLNPGMDPDRIRAGQTINVP